MHYMLIRFYFCIRPFNLHQLQKYIFFLVKYTMQVTHTHTHACARVHTRAKRQPQNTYKWRQLHLSGSWQMSMSMTMMTIIIVMVYELFWISSILGIACTSQHIPVKMCIRDSYQGAILWNKLSNFKRTLFYF